MCGLKPHDVIYLLHYPESHPSWVCGLKQTIHIKRRLTCSHTLRGCVDWNLLALPKRKRKGCHTLRGCVDWNISQKFYFYINKSHPSWVCGLKQHSTWCLWERQQRHTLRGCVDWNTIEQFKEWLGIVTPFVGVWIETTSFVVWGLMELVTPFVGVWIETLRGWGENPPPLVTPFVGVWIETRTKQRKCLKSPVTPFVGVWIETWSHHRFHYHR